MTVMTVTTVSEICDKVRDGVKPYFRPTLENYDCPCDELAGVIRRCWAEDPAERPDFQALRTLIKRLNKYVHGAPIKHLN